MLKICWPGSLESREEQSTYFKCISGYFEEICKAQNLHQERLEEARYQAIRKISKGKRLPEESQRYVGATLIADSHWTVPIITWMPVYYRLLFRVMEDIATEKLLLIAKENCDITEFRVPDFSFSEEVRIDGRPAVKEVKYSRQTLLGGAIMHTEWLQYVLRELNIEHDEELFRKTKKETKKYFASERKALSSEAANLQADIFRADAKWFEKAMKEFKFNSYSMGRFATLHKKMANEMEEIASKN